MDQAVGLPHRYADRTGEVMRRAILFALLCLLVAVVPVSAAVAPPSKGPTFIMDSGGDVGQCGTTSVYYLTTTPTRLCSVTMAAGGSSSTYWITASWDLEMDSLSQDTQWYFVGVVGYEGLFHMDVDLEYAPASLNVAPQRSEGPRPRITISRSFRLKSITSTDTFWLRAYKQGGNGSSLLYPYHTSLQVVQVK